MSTRAIKKLTKKDDLKELASSLNKKIDCKEIHKNEDEESEDEIVPKNKFNLLDEISDLKLEEEGSDEKEDPDNENDFNPTKKIKKKKNKKKSKKNENETNNSFKFVSTEIDEEYLCAKADELTASDLFEKEPEKSNLIFKTKHLFQIESKYLNADNEMIRMFGAKIVQSEKINNQRANRRGAKTPMIFKQNSIVNKKPTWPEFRRQGLSMKVLKENAESNSFNNNELVELTFEHSKEYQHIQFAFLDAVESLDHNNIINVLHMCPYHIDSLIQMSDISRMSDDTAMAADLIERALFALQNSFHPIFNFTSNSKSSVGPNLNFKLDYNRVENRCLFIALFKHLLYVGGKACYRTSLELCKLLLSLDVDNDPMGVILLIDFYAIRSLQYEYLIDFYETFNPFKHLYLMPNMIMSVALAHYNLYLQKNNSIHLEKAEKLLQDALIRFPAILMELLDKCNVVPDKQVESHWIFTKTSHLNVPKGLKYLIDLYCVRMHYEWKIAENLQWLEKNVKQIISKEKSVESSVNESKKKCKTLFSKTPPNLLRHLILSDLKEVAAHLPPEYSSNAIYSFDPIPPKNSIISYTRPSRTLAEANPTSTVEAISTFFQSLLPGFNVQEANQQRAVANNNQAQGGDLNNRFDIQQMVNRLREFLTQVEQHFPAVPQNDENNQNFDDTNEFD